VRTEGRGSSTTGGARGRAGEIYGEACSRAEQAALGRDLGEVEESLLRSTGERAREHSRWRSRASADFVEKGAAQ
jgi:hypothetical protein